MRGGSEPSAAPSRPRDSPKDIRSERSSLSGQALSQITKSLTSLQKVVIEGVGLLLESVEVFGLDRDEVEQELLETLDDRVIIALIYMSKNYDLNDAGIAFLQPLPVEEIPSQFCASYLASGETEAQKALTSVADKVGTVFVESREQSLLVASCSDASRLPLSPTLGVILV